MELGFLSVFNLLPTHRGLKRYGIKFRDWMVQSEPVNRTNFIVLIWKILFETSADEIYLRKGGCPIS